MGVSEGSYIKKTYQLVDMMTHAVTNVSFYTSLFKLDMYDIYVSTRRKELKQSWILALILLEY